MTTSSLDLTMTGTLRQPEDLRIRTSRRSVSCSTFGGHMSILVTTTNTGTESASASPRCSFVMPTIPAFAPTCTDYKLEVRWFTPEIKSKDVTNEVISNPYYSFNKKLK